MEAYEASKKTVEVSNRVAKQIKTEPYWIWLSNNKNVTRNWHKFKHNQPCEAEVTDKAIITKIL